MRDSGILSHLLTFIQSISGEKKALVDLHALFLVGGKGWRFDMDFLILELIMMIEMG